MCNRRTPALRGNLITFEDRSLLCPFSDPVKVAAWLKEWRTNPAVRLDEMRARLAHLQEHARRIGPGAEKRKG